MGFILILGILAPAILKVHERNHPFIIFALWRRFGSTVLLLRLCAYNCCRSHEQACS